jgi:signal transduction histidine kinase
MIHQHPRFQNTAILFISGVHMTDADRLRGYEHGAVDYISVPIIPELLRAKVKVFADLHRKTRQLETLNREMLRLSHQMITLQDEERRRMAREMHDGLGQDLVAAKMLVDTIRVAEASEKATEASQLIGNALRQVRSISHLLHPPQLDEAGLCAAIRWYLEGVTKRSGIQTFLEVPPDFPRLSTELETALYRIVQEALTNIFRHSGAQNAWVTLLVDDTQVSVKVLDNGKGITEQIAGFFPGSVGVGVSGMRQRVREFGGELRLQRANPGTLLEAIVPMSAAARATAQNLE